MATPHGWDTLARLDERLRAAEEHLLSALDTDEDRQLFRSMLRRLAVHASADAPVSAPCGAAGDGTLPC